jgi:hypothetical protein
MAGLINLRLLTDFFNKIGHKPIGREKRRRFEPSGKMCVEG